MTLAEQIAAVPYWYHRIVLPDGVITPGWAPMYPDAYRVDADLTGKRVLDVGAWDGYWTFEALRRGAREVVAIDDWSDLPNAHIWRPEILKTPRTAWDTFDLCRDALGYGEDRCKRITMSVYDAPRLGAFDVIFFFGTFYHLRHPMLALERLSAVCNETIYVESAICDDFSPYAADANGWVSSGHADKMVMEFYPGAELGRNPTNWWTPTIKTLTYMVRACGWPNIRAWKLFAKPTRVMDCRGFIRGGKTQ